MLTLQHQVVIELRRRSGLLPDEVGAWQDAANQNLDGMGIHKTQVEAVRILLDGLAARQEELLAKLVVDDEPAAFLRYRLELEHELTATHGILAIFRNILAQREEENFYRTILDAADLVAADCYRTVIDQATRWGAIDQDHVRVPPLTYLNADYSPAAFTRRHAFSAFRMPLEHYRDLKLPISIISLPFHHTRALWTYISIHHEVGHVLDQDLALTNVLRDRLDARLPDATGRRHRWKFWLREAIADTFGVLLGGSGFAYGLLKILLLPAAEVTTLDDTDSHPNAYVRVFLVGQLLRATGFREFAAAAEHIEDTWRIRYGEPEGLLPYVSDCHEVAKLLLGERIPELADRCLADLITSAELSAAHRRTVALATYLRTGLQRPAPTGSAGLFPLRLIPAAAELALREVDSSASDRIHDRALDFVTAVRMHLPQFLALNDLRPERRTYLSHLVREADFQALTTPSGVSAMRRVQ